MAQKTPDLVADEIIAKLRITCPGLSFELGTPERKIIDAVAEAISEGYVDQYLVGSLLDIESKAGLELEQWVATFGFGRLQGKKSEGVVRIELSTPNTQDVAISLGTQFYTRQGLPGTAIPLYFSASQAVVIPAGNLVADVPVQCTVVGVAGNVPPDSIVYLGSIIGATKVTNLTSFTGGVDVETDEELRQRFKDTFLRNIAGTADWYIGLAYQNQNVSKAVIFGPISKYVTQVNVPDVSISLPVSADVKYAWPEGEAVFQNLGADSETFYRPIDDYIFESGPSPALQRVDTGTMVVDEVVDVEFPYTTQSSRNDPLGGITNKVDMFVNGVDPVTVTERTVVSAQTLSSSSADPLYTGNFARVGSAGAPSAANRFMRLGSVPIVSFPSSIVVGAFNYQQGVHYHLLRGTTLLAGSVREVAGIEWTPAGPSSGTQLTLDYVYNRIPEVLGAVCNSNKQICTDILVHQAAYQYLRIYLSVEVNRGFVVSQVTNSIQDRLQSYFAGLPYGSWIQISDLNLAVHQVLGVDNVRLTTDAENAVDYGIKTYGSSADTVPTTIFTDDFKLNDNQLPIFIEAIVLRKPNR